MFPSPKRELDALLAATALLTRIPVGSASAHDTSLLSEGAKYFPLIGTVLGAFGGACYIVALNVGLPDLPAAALATAAVIFLTGGLHEDGLADCADGLGGGATRERALEIMRDSRIGSYGAIALILTLTLRVSALSSLSAVDGLLALIVALTGGRFFMLGTLCWLPYARESGLASGVAPSAPGLATLIGSTTFLAVALTAAQLAGLIAVIFGGVVWVAFASRVSRRLGGYTGDGLGAIEQVTGTTLLLVLCAAWT